MSEKLATTHENEALDDELRECENCHAPVQGLYCSQCGQSIESTLKYFWTVILHILDDVFSFDSRATRTLIPLMFKPGFLTNEYVAGRRVHYVPPLRLYLFISIIFFITLKFFAEDENLNSLNINNSEKAQKIVTEHIKQLTLQKGTVSSERADEIQLEIEKFSVYKNDLSKQSNLYLKGITSELVELELQKYKLSNDFSVDKQKDIDKITAKIKEVKTANNSSSNQKALSIGNNPDGSFTIDALSDEHNDQLKNFAALLEQKAEKAFKEDPGPLIQEVISKLPQLMFILLPIFALLLKIMFIFSKRLYLEHLTVALHSHSFIFLSILSLQILGYLDKQIHGSYDLASNAIGLATTLLTIWIPVYLFLMQKRVYKQGAIFTFIKFNFIGISYILLIALTGAIAFIWGLAST